MLFHLVGKQVGIDPGMHRHERLAEASREGGLRLDNSDFSARHLGGISGDEVVRGLRRRQAADLRQLEPRHRGL